MIYTVGDSHSWHGWCLIPGVKVKNTGPMTMFALGRDLPDVCFDIPTDGKIVFCWGEVDARCHIFKYQPWEKCMDQLVENYLRAIEKNVRYRWDQKDVYIYNVVPPPRRDVLTPSMNPENAAFPFRGSDQERLSFSTGINQRLKKSQFKFIDVYEKYSDADGFLNMAMSDGHVHIADPKPIMEFFNANA